MIPSLQSISWRSTGLITATYFYFLIFAQFAFLKAIELSGEAASLKLVMGTMGFAGILGSLTSPLFLKHWEWKIVLRIGFLSCGMMAFLSLASWTSAHAWSMIAGGIGFSLGIVTVTLVSQLRNLSGNHHWGMSGGLGTGLAYFTCNVPAVFRASPFDQSLIAGIVCVAAFFGTSIKIESSSIQEMRQSSPEMHAPFVVMLLAFTLLIWLDSAAFFIIQNDRELLGSTWGSDTLLWRNGSVHLLVAVFAGWWLESRNSLSPVFLALGILAAASWLVNDALTREVGGAIYPVGVSLYSTCLVVFPAYWLGHLSLHRRTFLASLLYAVAGWLGSGMGIGMAENLHRVPLAFVMVVLGFTGVVLAHEWLRKYCRELATCTTLLALAFVGSELQGNAVLSSQASISSIHNGREVYVSEGCIHCHSRYVRPSEDDITNWGPQVSYEEALKECPPLFGNRRQGPDLLNVGLRRSRAWLKAHFINPQLLVPMSTMPRYDYLFSDDRGESLIDFLMDPQASAKARYETIQNWNLTYPSDASHEVSNAWKLFQHHCSACHGEDGMGNGEARADLARSPANLRYGPFIYSRDPKEIPRILKFGIMGTDMPGHEYLPDRDIIAISSYVKSLRHSPHSYSTP